MLKRRTIHASICLILFLGVLAPQFGQNVSAGAGKPDEVRRSFAIGLVRTINTTELMEVRTYGSFAPSRRMADWRTA